MTHEEATRLARSLADAVNAHDTAFLMSLYSEDAVTVSPVSGEISGRHEIRKWWDRIFSLFPDWSVRVSDVLVDGDRIAFFGSAAATDREGWFGQPATGEHFEYRSMIVLTMRDGKIARDERIYDLSGVLDKLENARLEKELKTAADVQRILLPRIDRTTPQFDLVGDSVPCRAIGGDFFDSIPLSSGATAIVLGDVAGKGAPAALLGAMIQGMLTSEVRANANPAAVVSAINTLVCRRELRTRFCTLVYGVLNDGRFTYTNAGHPPGIVLKRDGIRRLSVSGPVLGVFANAIYGEQMIELREGDSLVLFSDGVTEARRENDEELGEQRLISSIAGMASRPAAEMLDGILATVRDFAATPADDMTVMIAKFRGSQ